MKASISTFIITILEREGNAWFREKLNGTVSKYSTLFWVLVAEEDENV